jgi:hypothetical protein
MRIKHVHITLLINVNIYRLSRVNPVARPRTFAGSVRAVYSTS